MLSKPCSALPAITRCPDMMSGEACFTGTRLPVKTLFDSIKAGETIEEFLEGFPFLSREALLSALDDAEQSCISVAPTVSHSDIVENKHAMRANAKHRAAAPHGVAHD